MGEISKEPSVVGHAKDVMGDVTERARQEAGRRFEERQQRSAGELHTVADALRHVELGDSGIGPYVDRAADQLDRVSAYLRDAQFQDLVQEARRVAQREPAMFLGGAFMLGLFAARLIRAAEGRGAGSYRREG